MASSTIVLLVTFTISPREVPKGGGGLSAKFRETCFQQGLKGLMVSISNVHTETKKLFSKILRNKFRPLAQWDTFGLFSS